MLNVWNGTCQGCLHRDKTRAGEAGNHREVSEGSFLQELLRKMPECLLLNRARIYTLTFHVGGSEVSANSFLLETSMTRAQSSGHTRCLGQKPEHRPGRGPPDLPLRVLGHPIQISVGADGAEPPTRGEPAAHVAPKPGEPFPSPPGFIFTFCKDVFV